MVIADSVIKLFMNKDFTLSSELTGPEVTMLMYLYNYVLYDSCILAHSNGKFLTVSNIIDIASVSENYVYKIMKSLVAKQVLAKCKIGDKVAYIMNPYIFQRGKRVNRTLYKLFKDTKWAKRFK